MKFNRIGIVLLILTAIPLMAQLAFFPVDDTYVRAGANASNNYGDETLIRVRGPENKIDNWRAIFLKFDLTGVSEEISSAVLKLTVYKAVCDYPDGDRADFFTVTDDSWSEGTVTWDTAPVSGDYLYSATFKNKGSADPDTTYEFDFTAYVQSELAGDKIVTIKAIDTLRADTNLHFFSKEDTAQSRWPQLVLTTGSTGIENNRMMQPESFRLNQNFPNPFNPETLISFELNQTEFVELNIYDIQGKVIRYLLQQSLTSGSHIAEWDGRDEKTHAVPSGIYIARLCAGKQTQNIKMLLSR